MLRIYSFAAGMLSAWLLLGCGVACCEDVQDVILATPFRAGQRPTTARFLYNDREVGSGREAFVEVIGRIRALAAGTSIVWGPNYAHCGACSGVEPNCLPMLLYPDLWKELEQIIAERQLVLSSAYPGPFIASTYRTRPPIYEGISIGWSNYRGPDTPHDEVLYYVNGAHQGRGDEGFDLLLQQLAQAPRDAMVFLPRYQYGGRAAFENLGLAEIETRNAKLRSVVPFVSRRREFDDKLQERRLRLEYKSAGLDDEQGTVLNWGVSHGSLMDIVSVGRIVRHDEQPLKAAARLAWTRFDAYEVEKRKSETTAIYILNDVELGEGVAGFAAAMQKISELPAGSVVQSRICVRTKGPFTCPRIYEGQRHFARSGYEPYVGMLPWLIDVAQRRKLQIEWLPDEQPGIGDCELNR